KDVCAFEKEWPLLRKKCLELAEIHHGRVDFNLPEIGIDRRIQCDIAAQSVFQIHSGCSRQTVTAVKRIVWSRWPDELAFADDVGHQVEVPTSLKPIDAFEIVHSRSGAAFIFGHHLQPDGLIFPVDVSCGIDSPYLMATR